MSTTPAAGGKPAATAAKPDVGALAKKHHFWILTAVLLAVAVPCWYLGTSNILAQTDAWKQTLNQKFSDLDAEQNRREGALPYHPNENFKRGMLVVGDEQARNVWSAWETLYKHQVDTVLKWPAGLSEIDREELENGKFFVTSKDDPRSVEVRTNYRNYVLRDEPKRLENRLKLLKPKAVQPKLAAAAAAAAAPAAGGAPGAPGAPVSEADQRALIEYDGIVLWPEFMSIFNAYGWRDRYPSPTEVRCCQEDIWAYTGLFDVVAQANDGVEDFRKAWIKQIVSLEIGKAVPPPTRTLQTALGVGVGADGAMPGYPSGGGAEGYAGPGIPGVPGPGGGGEAGSPEAAADKFLIDRRYVRANGQPILASEEDPDPEYNLIPFRLRVRMDQRRIMSLLSVCANSALPIRVREVQVAKWGEMSSASGGSAAASFGGGRGAAALPLPTAEELRGPYDVALELRGTIYIYQRPNPLHIPELLRKLAEENAKAAADAKAAGSPPGAAATPTSPTLPGGAAPPTSPTLPGGAAPAVPGAPGEAAPATGAPAFPGAPAVPGAAAPGPAVPGPGGDAAPAVPATTPPTAPTLPGAPPAGATPADAPAVPGAPPAAAPAAAPGGAAPAP